MHRNVVERLKEQYSRDLRKKVVKSMLQHEKSKDKEAQDSSYKIVDQIFSYIMSDLGWSISQDSHSWNDAPLKIMSDVFPKIESTKWFKEKKLHVTKSINIEGNFS